VTRPCPCPSPPTHQSQVGKPMHAAIALLHHSLTHLFQITVSHRSQIGCLPHLYYCLSHLYYCLPHLYYCLPHLYCCCTCRTASSSQTECTGARPHTVGFVQVYACQSSEHLRVSLLLHFNTETIETDRHVLTWLDAEQFSAHHTRHFVHWPALHVAGVPQVQHADSC